jgi:diaminopropionate ammonia-lyase
MGNICTNPSNAVELPPQK